jgi:hypothetical protein
MKKQSNMMSTKERNNSLATGPKDINMAKIPDKEFKRIIMKKLNGIQENTDRQKKLGKQCRI